MSTFKAWLFGLFLLSTGCTYMAPPDYIAIDSAFSESERATIESTIDAWCEEVGWCPTRAAWVDRGRITLVDDLSEDENTAKRCPEGHTCVTGGRNDGDNIRIARNRPGADDMGALWVAVAHELGHYCTEHLKTGLMAAAHEIDDAPVIDPAAARAWREGCDGMMPDAIGF